MKMTTWIAIFACAGMLSFGPTPSVRAADNDRQVEQLQKQLAAMQEEMAALRKELETKDIPADRRTKMQGHMDRMDQHWQSMHQDCCMMDPNG